MVIASRPVIQSEKKFVVFSCNHDFQNGFKVNTFENVITENRSKFVSQGSKERQG